MCSKPKKITSSHIKSHVRVSFSHIKSHVRVSFSHIKSHVRVSSSHIKSRVRLSFSHVKTQHGYDFPLYFPHEFSVNFMMVVMVILRFPDELRTRLGNNVDLF